MIRRNDMTLGSVFLTFLFPSAFLASAWWVWLRPDETASPPPQWRKKFLLGGLICGAAATFADIAFIRHATRPGSADNLPVSAVWTHVGRAILILSFASFIALVLGKGDARILLSVWLFSFLVVNYITFLVFFTY